MRVKISLSKLLFSNILLLSLLLTACQTWYKRGAGGDQLAEDQQRCQDETGTSSGQAFSGCMQRAGWHHGDKASGVIQKDNVDTPAVNVTAKPATVQPDQEATENTTITGDAPSKAAYAEEVSTVRDDPVQPESVGAWFKLGANTDQLEHDQALCEKAKAQEFMQCMQSKGWHAVGTRLSPNR